MPIFSGSKKQLQADAARYTERAKEQAAEARKLRKQADKVRRDDRNSLIRDPEAARAIARDLDTNRRICEDNARDYRRAAAEVERLSRKWF